MNLWQSILIGIIEGLTEYLPVSSTGHILLAQRVLGIPATEEANAFAICIQSGAIVAVIGLFFQRIKGMLIGFFGQIGLSRRDDAGLRLGTNVIIAFFPAAVVGLLVNDLIEEFLFGLIPVTFAWFVGGILILFVTWRRGNTPQTTEGIRLGDLTWKGALFIGSVQCIAMWPGTSRSLVTIVGGIIAGLGVSAAVEFSFLLGVVTLLAATAYESLKTGAVMIESYSLSTLLMGTFAAYISAVFSVKWMVGYLKQHDMAIFGYYRVAIALIVGTCIYFQQIVG